MREIRSPLSGFLSPVGMKRGAVGASPAPLTVYDFANGYYFADGQERTLSEMWQVVDNGFWTTDYVFNPADVVPGDGWVVDATGDLNNYLLFSEIAKAGWWDGGTYEFAFVMDCEFIVSNTSVLLVFATPLGSTNNIQFGPEALLAGTPPASSIYLSGSGVYLTPTVNLSEELPFGNGPVKVGFSFTATEIKVSVNGALVETIPLSINAPLSQLSLPFINGSATGTIIKSIKVYPPSADIVALTRPDWVPERAEAFLDFLNDRYWVGGAVVSRSAVISTPSSVTVSGLESRGGEAVPGLIGAAATAFAQTNKTFVIETEYVSGDGVFITYGDYGVGGYPWEYYTGNSGAALSLDAGDTDDYYGPADSTPITLGINRVAFNASDVTLAVSTDGSAVGTAASGPVDAPTGAANSVFFGGLQSVGIVDPTYTFNTRTMAVYALKDQSELVGLSTP
ncbi:hypothetical protein FHS52_001132 [Erythromicrobium ramosum]|uniref:Uncharacterized protein n=1 Tax=Erythrobacter ramosus TaxID=35811 RepID=A0A6I4UFC3_9SPHN|nr:hypothetical protein [Erythrobacter ramosus]MBB3775189.1 hypothetical protein [Erythrobacter ramosus]MXP37186.1 hypothetical protein [Erythrobacter ramosus]